MCPHCGKVLDVVSEYPTDGQVRLRWTWRCCGRVEEEMRRITTRHTGINHEIYEAFFKRLYPPKEG